MRKAAGIGRHNSIPPAGTGSTVTSTTDRAAASGPNPNRPRVSGTSAAGGPSVTVTARSSVAGSTSSTPARVPGCIVTVTGCPFTVYVVVPSRGTSRRVSVTVSVKVSVTASPSASVAVSV